MKSEMESFDGRDNRMELMVMLQRLGSDQSRARFLRSLIPASRTGLAGVRARITGLCDPVSAYFILVGICNEVGVSINHAAKRLTEEVRRL